MTRIKFILLLLACIAIVSGCATTQNWPKQLDEKLSKLDGKALVLASVSFENKIDSTDGFFLDMFLIGSQGDNYEKINLNHRDNIKVLSGNRMYFLVVIDINPGDNYFYSVRGKKNGYWFTPLFEAPILLSFQAKGNEIQYIGNIKLTLREKTSESEHRAGPITPLIDQASIINATFDVEISDEYERDIKEYQRIFPNIAGRKITKRILPSWKRPTPDEFEPKRTHFFFF